MGRQICLQIHAFFADLPKNEAQIEVWDPAYAFLELHLPNQNVKLEMIYPQIGLDC